MTGDVVIPCLEFRPSADGLRCSICGWWRTTHETQLGLVEMQALFPWGSVWRFRDADDSDEATVIGWDPLYEAVNGPAPAVIVRLAGAIVAYHPYGFAKYWTKTGNAS